MTTYGSIPGVRISTGTGTISGVTIGRDQYLLLAGIGSEEANVSANEPTQIESRTDADEKFGPESDIANAYRRVTSNGASPEYIRGVRASTTDQTEEATSETGTLPEGPIVPDPSRISAEETTSTDSLNVSLSYESPPPVPDAGEVVVNPYTREFESSVTETTIDYLSADWESALYSYQNELVEGEFGVLAPLTADSDVGLTMEGLISEMRNDLKMVVGVLGAEYNNTDDTGEPLLDIGNYDDSFDNDTLWVAGPTALEELDNNAARGVGALSAVAGLMAGNATTEPIYDSTLRGISGLQESITRADVKDLRNNYVMPVRDTGTIRLEDNRSSYDQEANGGWERDFFRRRIVDLTMATMYLIARQQIGGILDSDTVDDVQDSVQVELSNLVEDRLLEPDQQEVNVYRQDDRTIGMELTITPLGVAKGADIDLSINA